MKTPSTSFLFAALLAVACHAQAAPGDLDLSFAGTGTTRIGFGFGEDNARAVAVQADGKLVVAGSIGLSQNFVHGNFSVVRYGTNNLPDPTFGFRGTVITPVSADGLDFAFAGANAVIIQADGKIVAAGYAYTGPSHSDFTLVRYNPDGSLDTTFGTIGNGIVYTDFGPQGAEANALAIQQDGRMVVAGHYFNGGSVDFALARYNTNGTLDPSFGGTGKFLTEVQNDASARAITLQPDGKILVAGSSSSVTLVRYTTNGMLDSTFGPNGDGKVFTTIAPGLFSSASAVAIQFGINTPQNPDKIVVAGDTEIGFGQRNFALLRYNLDGTLDTSFNGTGIVTNAVGPGSSYGQAILIQGSRIQPRKIIVAGYTISGGTRGFALARYNANGSFDTTFNGTGQVITPIGPSDDEANALAFQAGKIVAVGSSRVNAGDADFAIARYNSDGSLDTSFDGDGKITTGVADRPAPAKAVAIQTDGKTVVAGYAENGVTDVFALARFNLDGSPDTSFGANGKVTTSIGAGGARGNAVVIQPDGKIVAAGFAGNNQGFALVRYDTNGTPDVSFGVNGIVMTPIGTGADEASALTLQSDGKIVVAGSTSNGANTDFAVVRYTTNGALDTSFSGDGKVTAAIGTSDETASAVKVQADGKIIVAGTTVIGTSYDFALVRYNTNGSLDNSFGTLGRVVTDLDGGSFDLGQSMAIQPNGRILVGGISVKGPVTFAAARYHTNGTLDTSFDGDGKVTTRIGLGLDFGYAMALQNEGKIVMAGASTTGEAQFAAVRYNVDGSLDNSYGTAGTVIVVFGNGADNTGYALALDSIGRPVIAGDAGGIFGVARLQGDPFLRIRSIVRRADGQIVLEGLGVPAVAQTIQVSPNPSPEPFGPLDTVTPDAAGLWQYQDASAVGLPMRFYRLSLP